MGEKGFTARLDKGLFTFYIEQETPVPKMQIQFSNTQNQLKNVTERNYSLLLQTKQKQHNTERKKVERNVVQNIRSVKNRQGGQKLVSKRMRTNFAIKQNKTLHKYRQRQLSIKTMCSFLKQVPQKQQRLSPIVLNDIFRSKKQVFTKLKPTNREKYNMSTIAYRSLASNQQRYKISTLQTQRNVNIYQEQKNTQRANMIAFKKSQNNKRYFKYAKIPKFQSSIHQSVQQTERLNSQQFLKNRRYKTSMSYFQDKNSDLFSKISFKAI